MSRLYLGIISLFLGLTLFGQSDLKRYLELGEERFKQGDYIHALKYYDEAMKLDSTAVHTLWAYAEALRAYKDYRKAEYYYGEIFKREGTEIFPASLLYYGLMQKHNGKYDEAIETFKKGKKIYRNDMKGYLYLKCKREFESCLWAKSQMDEQSKLIFEHLPEHINTKDAEFVHRIHNNQLLFSSLKADSIGSSDEVFSTTYKTRLYTSKIQEETYNKVELLKDLAFENLSSGNGTWSLDGTKFYFSLCRDDNYNYRCKIMVAEYADGRFTNIDSLGVIINESGANTTMPFIGEWDGEEVLFYASDRNDGKGGMDIWYSFIVKGNQFKKPQNVKRINSMDNELTPYWDGKTKTLYFSSSWHDGFGGLDVFKTTYGNGGFGDPVNLGIPVNSPANDIYYFQTTTGDTSYFSSNRLGVNYSKNPTCCSDIFLVRKPIDPPPPTIKETLEDLNRRLPVTLYFHNDIPNPRSWDTTSNVNYMDSYKEYTAMLDKYKKEYSKGLAGNKAEDAKDDIEDFFTQFVDQGVKDLFLFRDLLLEELKKGRRIQMTVKGFASPLAKTDYNVNLTKRRIASLVNYLREFEDGVFAPYLDNTAANGGQLMVVQVPFGEYQADQLISDNPNDVQNSVYSRAAAMERKIEIQSVDVIRKGDTLSTIYKVLPPLVDFGKLKHNQIVDTNFEVVNEGETAIKIQAVRIPCDCNTAEPSAMEILPGQRISVRVTFDPTLYSGHVVKSVYLQLENGEEIRLVMTSFVE
jgi:tetratricopeptide (TPR) repeat protein